MPDRTAEQLYRGLLRGPLRTQAQSKSNQWAGRSTISSGSETVVVSTTSVDSNSVILIGFQSMAGDVVGSLGNAVCVRSISPGNFFTLGTTDSQAATRDLAVMWLIVPTQ